MDYSGDSLNEGPALAWWVRLMKPYWLITCLLLLIGCGRPDAESVRRFDVDQGLAKDTLKEAARQAEVEFIFSSNLVKDLTTPALKGRYSPSDAFQLMLADSPFIVVQHEGSGVYSIRRLDLSDHDFPQLDP